MTTHFVKQYNVSQTHTKMCYSFAERKVMNTKLQLELNRVQWWAFVNIAIIPYSSQLSYFTFSASSKRGVIKIGILFIYG